MRKSIFENHVSKIVFNGMAARSTFLAGMGVETPFGTSCPCLCLKVVDHILKSPKKLKFSHTWGGGRGGKVQGGLLCCWWNGRTCQGSRGTQGTTDGTAGGPQCTACRLYTPRAALFPSVALKMVTKPSWGLWASRYRPSCSLGEVWKDISAVHTDKNKVLICSWWQRISNANAVRPTSAGRTTSKHVHCKCTDRVCILLKCSM